MHFSNLKVTKMTKEDIKKQKLPWAQKMLLGSVVYGTVVCSPAIITYAMWRRRKHGPND